MKHAYFEIRDGRAIRNAESDLVAQIGSLLVDYAGSAIVSDHQEICPFLRSPATQRVKQNSAPFSLAPA
jgi:hypothetical protein